VIAVAALAVVLLSMLVELRISRRNERLLLSRGAVQPPDPVYRTMRWAYPGVFAGMAAEGIWRGAPSARLMIGGAIVFAAAKLLKGWAIYSLRGRWTYRVFVLPGAPLVTGGPYRWLRHPNYLGVVGEIAGFALLAGARWSGPIGVLLFGELLRQRIRAEERALGLSR
jgi:methyltransferase